MLWLWFGAGYKECSGFLREAWGSGQPEYPKENEFIPVVPKKRP